MGFLNGESLSDIQTPVLVTSGEDTLYESPSFSESTVSQIADSLVDILVFSNYPFAVVNSNISVNEQFQIDFEIDSGVYVDSLKLKFYSHEPIKQWLLSMPIGGDRQRSYDYNLLHEVEKVLEVQPYITSVSIGAPELVTMSDTSTVYFPVLISSLRSLFFDGSVVWSSEGEGSLVGYLDISLLNLFWSGEEIAFQFYGDDVIQKATLETEIPYILRTPFSLNGLGKVEVGKGEYGYLEGKIGVNYDIWLVWQAGFGFRYYEVTDEIGDQRQFAGVELSLQKRRVPFYYGAYQWGTRFVAGTGVTIETEEKTPRGDFSVHAQFQWKLPKRFALGLDLFTGAVATERLVDLHETEKIRVGGAASIRGYNENNYSFVGTGYTRNELRYYFPHSGSLFLFGDIGGGVINDFEVDNFKMLFGYGAGIRIPARKIHFSLMWARHYKEPLGPGRIHVGLGN